jgi:uncharacterized caspase-like protein
VNASRDVVSPIVGPSTDPGRNVVVTIGVDRYRHWHPLSCAVSDARGARDMFHRLGFIDAAPPLHDEQATRDAMIALVTDELKTLNQNDNLVLFYAGHGGTRVHELAGKQLKTGYLIPVDAAIEPNKLVTWIDLDDWLRKVALLPPRHILVIVDACHSGIALNSVFRWRDDRMQHASLAALHVRRSRRIITSALDDQRAIDSGPMDGHSLFTGCLIEALSGGMGRAGMVTGSAIGLWVQQRVRTYPDSQQTPDVGAFDFDDRGEMMIPLATRPDHPERTAQVDCESPYAQAGSHTTPSRGFIPARYGPRPLAMVAIAVRRHQTLSWVLAAILFWLGFLVISSAR